MSSFQKFGKLKNLGGQPSTIFLPLNQAWEALPFARELGLIHNPDDHDGEVPETQPGEIPIRRRGWQGENFPLPSWPKKVQIGHGGLGVVNMNFTLKFCLLS